MNATTIDNETAAPWRGGEAGAVVFGELEARAALPGEMQRVRAALDGEHYLGAGREVGRTLVQIVHHRGRWAAILLWGPAAMRLADRDEWIGWTHRQRAERLGLVVQNRRFLVLAEARMPNLASHAMGLALRQLPEQWERKHGYRPLLAESFTDIEAFEGTCYKASNWEPCGLTKGFGRLHRADFYRQHKRPKKLWLKALSRNTRAILAGMDIPAAYRGGCNPCSAERALPVSKAHLESLREALREVPDPRAANRSWPISALLGLVCLGLLAGRRNLAAIHRYGHFLTRQQRAWLGFPPKPGGRPGRRAPSYQALYHLLGLLDPNTLADALNGWLAAHHGSLPRALALDGKYIRELVLTLAFSEHGSGAPVAVTIASRQPKSQAAKTEGEITAAKRLYPQVNLHNAVVTGDALHCERESMHLVVENGGDFLFQVKEDQPTAMAEVRRVAASASPLLPAQQRTAGTGG